VRRSRKGLSGRDADAGTTSGTAGPLTRVGSNPGTIIRRRPSKKPQIARPAPVTLEPGRSKTHLSEFPQRVLLKVCCAHDDNNKNKQSRYLQNKNKPQRTETRTKAATRTRPRQQPPDDFLTRTRTERSGDIQTAAATDRQQQRTHTPRRSQGVQRGRKRNGAGIAHASALTPGQRGEHQTATPETYQVRRAGAGGRKDGTSATRRGQKRRTRGEPTRRNERECDDARGERERTTQTASARSVITELNAAEKRAVAAGRATPPTASLSEAARERPTHAQQ